MLYGIKSLSDTTFTDQIVDNVISYFDWGMLSIGGFFNVNRSVARFSNMTTLTVADDPNYAKGQVWESRKGGWIWESGLPLSSQPIQISGVYINNVFSPNGSGFHIDYDNSQVIFNTPQSSSAKVEVNFSYRKFNFYDGDVPWFRQVIFDPLPPSGVRSILADNRVYLPAVIVEPPASRLLSPYEMGSFSKTIKQDILFHVLTESSSDRSKIVDIMSDQYQQTLQFYDLNTIADANAFYLNDDGTRNMNSFIYPQLVDRFPWKKATISNVRAQEITNQLPLFRAVVRATFDVDSA